MAKKDEEKKAKKPSKDKTAEVPKAEPKKPEPQKTTAELLGYDPNGQLGDIFTQFEDAAAVWPLPLQWLLDSLVAGRALEQDSYREKPQHE